MNDPTKNRDGGNRLLDFRVALTTVLALVLLFSVVSLRPRRITGIYEDAFWRAKINARNSANVVFGGDSRVLRGISPAAFQSQLDGITAYNFGFRSTPLTREYLEAAAEVIQLEGPRVLVLGVTPNTFTPESRRDNGFDSRSRDRGKNFPAVLEWLGPLLTQLRPMSLTELAHWVREPNTNRGQYRRFHSDGWAESNMIPTNQHANLRTYRTRFTNNRPTPAAIEEATTTISRLVDQGILVIGFRPPTTTKLRELEDGKSGFPWEAFLSAFSAAGAHWVEVEEHGCQTYDGGHLRGEDVPVYSMRLADQIGPLIPSRDEVTGRTHWRQRNHSRVFEERTANEREETELKVENGKWRMENGEWRMENGEWRIIWQVLEFSL